MMGGAGIILLLSCMLDFSLSYAVAHALTCMVVKNINSALESETCTVPAIVSQVVIKIKIN